MSTLEAPTTVAVVYPHLPHYRRTVFREIDENPMVRTVFLAGTQSVEGTIALMDPSELHHHVALDNRWVGSFLWQRGLLTYLLRTDAAVVVFLGDWHYISTWVGSIVMRLRRRRVLFWTIGWHRPDYGVRRVVRLAFYRLAHQLLLYGEAGRRLGLRAGFPADRMIIVGNSVATPPAHRTPPRAPRRTWIVAVARPTAGKRLDLLLRAVAAMPVDRRPPVRIVGEGPERRRLIALARELGVRLEAAGAEHDPDRIAQYYSEAVLTVLPQAAGLTVLQSLGHGVPVVTTDSVEDQMPEFEAIRPGVTGDLYRHGDVDALRYTIEHWCQVVESDPDRVFDACRHAVAGQWSPEGNARRVLSAVLR